MTRSYPAFKWFLILSLLAAVMPLMGQTSGTTERTPPTPIAGLVTYSKPSAAEAYQATHPTATFVKADANGLTFRQPDGKYALVTGPGLSYQQAGKWYPTKLQVATASDGSGWLLGGTAINAKLNGGLSSVRDLTITSGPLNFKLQTPGLAYLGGDLFRFQESGTEWLLRVSEASVSIEATVARRQGKSAAAHTFVYLATSNASVTTDKNGHLSVADEVHISRARLVGADGRTYFACTPWKQAGQTVSFSCDDSNLPEAAFPYVIDPIFSGSGWWMNYNVDWAEQACCGGDGDDYPSVYSNFNPGIPDAATVYSLDFNTGGFSYSWQPTSGSPTCSYNGTSWSDRFGGQDLQAIKFSFSFNVNVRMQWPKNGSLQTCTGAGSGDVYATVSYSGEDITPPYQPSGPTTGAPNVSYSYSAYGSSNNYNNPVQYLFNWGDGSDSGWLPLGVNSASHAWGSAGVKSVTAYGRDYYTYLTSAASSALGVTLTTPTTTITTSPANRTLTIDGFNCTAPCTFQWLPNTQHTIMAPSPQVGAPGTQYTFSGWSDNGAASHTISAPASAATWTATFTTQTAGFSYARVLVVDHNKVPNTDQSNFPVLVSISNDSNLKDTGHGGHVQSPYGYDICFFADSARSTPLAWEVESYDNINGSLRAWVKIPLLSHTSDASFFVFYGNTVPTIPQSSAAAVWDGNFRVVLHLSGNGNDSTGNNNAVVTGASVVAAKIAQGYQFTQPTDRIATAVNSVLDTNSHTIAFWLRMDANSSNWNQVIAYEPPGSDRSPSIWTSYGANCLHWRYDPNNSGPTVCGGPAGENSFFTLGTWYLITGTKNGGTFTFYVNGTAVEQGAVPNPKTGGPAALELGRAASNAFLGALDEVRISNTVRSADWIATEYNNQSSPGNFCLVGNESIFPTTAADFSIAVTPSVAGGIRGGGATYAVTVGGLTTGSGINLSVTSPPDGTAVTFSPSALDGTGTSTMTLYPTASTPPVYSLYVTGARGSYSHNARTSLVSQDASNYSYYQEDPLTSINTSNWYQNGTLQAGANGISGVGALISKVGAPDGNDYDIRATAWAGTGNCGWFTLFARANSDRSTAYALNFSVWGVSLTKAVSGVTTGTTLASYPAYCENGMTIRMIVQGADITIMYGGYTIKYHDSENPILTGQPGVGVSANGSISNVQIGRIDHTAPPAVNQSATRASTSPRWVDLSWPVGTDDANGIGIGSYKVYRTDLNPAVQIGTTMSPGWLDETVTPGMTAIYAIYAVDQHGNVSAAPATISAAVPTAGSPDARRVGLRGAGAYWGAAGEQIDMMSGNLNFSLPLLKAVGRGGWGATFGLSYNSQIWRKEVTGAGDPVRLLSPDAGLGVGWKLQAGSIRPVCYAGSKPPMCQEGPVHHYVFSDSTGAEYLLDQNSNNVWTSLEGAYVFFDATAGKLYFTDGTFWVMSVVSGSYESDAGNRYPSKMQDTNGNFIEIHYGPGLNEFSWSESSSRIVSIQDSRMANGYSTYTFTWSSNRLPHLVSINNWVGTSENYSFTMNGKELLEPFGDTVFGNQLTLDKVTVNGLNIGHTFSYGTAGELTQVITPLGGRLRWEYASSPAYSSNRRYRQVSRRYMRSTASATEYDWSLSYEGTGAFHSAASLIDNGTNYGSGVHAKKTWTFVTSEPAEAASLTATYEEGTTAPVVLLRKEFTWSTQHKDLWTWQIVTGAPYVGTAITRIKNDAIWTSSKTTQILDKHGNPFQTSVYDYEQSSATRSFEYLYLHQNPANGYGDKYILNRLTGVTRGGTYLMMRDYDYPNLVQSSAGNNRDAASTTSYLLRGNVSTSRGYNGGDAVNVVYDTAGIAVYSSDNNGHSVSVQSRADSNYSLPGIITPNGNEAMQTSTTYNSAFAVTATAGPNSSQATTTYDSYGRPATSTIPDGATTTYTYTYPPADLSAPATQTATVNGRWQKTTVDGFGRTIKMETGHDTTTVSKVDSEYAPCACSPLGKLKRVSQPYAGASATAWTTNDYDACGRTAKVTLPDGASNTTYTYEGNSTTVIDPAGKRKTSITNIFGNLTSVIEPDPAGGTGTVSTNYTYTDLDQLATVTMIRGGVTQTRTFTYTGTDLMSVTNPENGTVSYTYDASHQVATKTDAMGQRTEYDYDQYGRTTQVRYYGANQQEKTSERVTYTYDVGEHAVGKLTGVAFGGGRQDNYGDVFSYAYTYGEKGRIATQQMRVAATVSPYTPGNPYTWMTLTSSYGWDTEGRMTSMQYPTIWGAPGTINSATLATLGYSYDADGQLTTMTRDGQPYAAATYGTAGEMTQLSYAGITESRTYNALLQMTSQKVPGHLNMTYNYSATANNGRITSSVDGVTGENVTFGYDGWNRLTSAAETATSMWSTGYTYDGFGNLTQKTGTGAAAGTAASFTFDGNNRQVGVTYDANGNQFADGVRTSAWTVANRLASTTQGAATTVYGYDQGGKRIMKGTPGGNFEYHFYSIAGQRLLTIGCHPVQGQVLPGCMPLGEDIYFKGKMLLSNGVTVVTDRLGSVRKNLQGQGESFAYFPYGEERTSTVDGRDKFGTYFRDSAGQDYADQRYYAVGTGRFTSPDPAGVAAVDIQDPTTWNNYLYVGGDPINTYDPSGLCDVVIGGITQNNHNALGSVETYAGIYGSISVYPYSQNSNTSSFLNTLGSTLSGIAEVAVQSFTSQSSTYAAVVGLLLAAQDGKPINVTTFSGGAAALTAAVAFLNNQGDAGRAVVGMINTITYVAPGAAQTLYNNGNATFIGGGALNNLVGAGTSISQPATVLLDQNHCGHDFQCLIDEFGGYLTNGDPCQHPAIVNQPPRYWFADQYDPLMGQWRSRWNRLMQTPITSTGEIPFVTSRIKPL